MSTPVTVSILVAIMGIENLRGGRDQERSTWDLEEIEDFCGIRRMSSKER